YEHEIMIRERFEKKFAKSVETIKQRHVKVMSLKSRLEKAEGEATEVIRLRGRVSELEAAIARANELADIGDKNAEFLGPVSSSTPHMLTAMAGKAISMAINKGIQEGLEAGIKHGKAGRSLEELEAYDNGIAAEHVATANELKNVSFSLLDQLDALKDSPFQNSYVLLDVGGGSWLGGFNS
ncbi:hypothetical protein Tco_0177080, partial [Tanacetum coccineum]